MRFQNLARVLMAVAAATELSLAQGQDIYRASGGWRDDQNQPYALESLYGTPTVITMAYGACRRVCSTSIRMMEQLQVLADSRHLQMNFVVVGLDPQADRPQDWAQFRADNHLARSNWVFLSGDDLATRQLAQRLGVRYWRYGEHTLHDLRIVLLSSQAQPVRAITAFDQRIDSLLP